MFNIKPSSSKHKDRAVTQSNDHRRSNQVINNSFDRRNEPVSNQNFHDLRMYLKAPRKK